MFSKIKWEKVSSIEVVKRVWRRGGKPLWLGSCWSYNNNTKKGKQRMKSIKCSCFTARTLKKALSSRPSMLNCAYSTHSRPPKRSEGQFDCTIRHSFLARKMIMVIVQPYRVNTVYSHFLTINVEKCWGEIDSMEWTWTSPSVLTM